MARLRLFANLREAAGSAEMEMPGSTVEEVLDNAVDRFGTRFAAGLGSAQVWVNGERAAGGGDRVGPDDEVALIPPVSGGATVVRSPASMEIGLIAVLAIALFTANAIDLKWFTMVTVLAGGVWAYDVIDYAGRRGLAVAIGPALLGVLSGALATYRWGVPGMAAATAGAGIVALMWAVLVPRFRPIETVTATAVVALLGAFGMSAMVLLRLRSKDEAIAFLVVAVAAVAAAWFAGQAQTPVLDPLVVTLLAAIVAGLIAATVWADEVLPTLLASTAAAIALVAGRNLGSLMRTGGFYLDGSVPGSLHAFDAMVMAAGPFWLVLTAFD